MEPRNFGVIVWSRGRVAAQFLGEPAGKHVPTFVPSADRAAYRQWLKYWRTIISQDELKSDKGKKIPSSSPEFIDAIRAKAKPHFMLVEGGMLLEEAPLPDLVTELFALLVEDTSDMVKAHSATLKKASNSVLAASGAKERGDFHHDKEVPCKIGHMMKRFRFDYAIGGNEDAFPAVVFQRVPVLSEKSVHSAAFMFERLKQSRSNKLKSIGRYAFIYHSAEHDHNGNGHTDGHEGNGHIDVASNIDLIREFADVVDVSQASQATLKIQSVLPPLALTS
jgi:hypothetical protein